MTKVAVQLDSELSLQDRDILTAAFTAAIAQGATTAGAVQHVYATVLNLKTPDLCVLGPIWYRAQFRLDVAESEFADPASYATATQAVALANQLLVRGGVETDITTNVIGTGGIYQIKDADEIIVEYTTVQVEGSFRRLHTYKAFAADFGATHLVKLLLRQKAIMGL